MTKRPRLRKHNAVWPLHYQNPHFARYSATWGYKNYFLAACKSDWLKDRDGWMITAEGNSPEAAHLEVTGLDLATFPTLREALEVLMQALES